MCVISFTVSKNSVNKVNSMLTMIITPPVSALKAIRKKSYLKLLINKIICQTPSLVTTRSGRT